MSSTSTPRFRIRLEDGSEIAISSVEALARRVSRGDLLPDTPLFDTSIGGWGRAGDVPVVRFIIEEIVRDSGDVPDGWANVEDSGSEVIEKEEVSREADLGIPDFSTFTILEDEAPAPAPASASRGEIPSPPPAVEEASKFGFTLEALPADLEIPAPPPAPPREEPVIPIEGTGDWMQSGLGGGFDESYRTGPDPSDGGGRSATKAAEEGFYAGGDLTSRTAHKKSGAGERITRIILLGIAVTAGTWYWFDRVERGFSYLVEVGRLERPERVIDTSVPFIRMPDPAPAPPGVEPMVASALERFAEGVRSAIASLRDERRLAAVPPEDWLSGYYMAHAREFPEVREFWEGYRLLIEDLHRQDQAIFDVALEAEAAVLEERDAEGARILRGYMQTRWNTALSARDALYSQLAVTADAALALHDFLIANESSIRFTPALGVGVAGDPIMEIEIAQPGVEAEFERRLERVLDAIDRSRGEEVPIVDGIGAALFSSIERF